MMTSVIFTTFGWPPGHLVTCFARGPSTSSMWICTVHLWVRLSDLLSTSTFSLQGSASKLWHQVSSWALQLWATLWGWCAMPHWLGSGTSLWLFQSRNSGRQSGDIFEGCGITPSGLGQQIGNMRMRAPDNSGSSFYNYKGYFSFVLVAACDARYKFRYVSVGLGLGSLPLLVAVTVIVESSRGYLDPGSFAWDCDNHST